MATLEIYLGCRGSIKTRGIPVLWGGLNPKVVGEAARWVWFKSCLEHRGSWELLLKVFA